uniref:Putative secreted protein n=1 Tax=Ixodes ricinus TaxID=34613 RepID=V5GJ01_IXORI
MFKLSFLIVFVLAGLCFGAGSEDVSSSADQGHSGQGPEISADGSSDNGDSSGDASQLGETSGKQETKPTRGGNSLMPPAKHKKRRRRRVARFPW